jgi:hypothetical protein
MAASTSNSAGDTNTGPLQRPSHGPATPRRYDARVDGRRQQRPQGKVNDMGESMAELAMVLQHVNTHGNGAMGRLYAARWELPDREHGHRWRQGFAAGLMALARRLRAAGIRGPVPAPRGAG